MDLNLTVVLARNYRGREGRQDAPGLDRRGVLPKTFKTPRHRAPQVLNNTVQATGVPPAAEDPPPLPPRREKTTEKARKDERLFVALGGGERAGLPSAPVEWYLCETYAASLAEHDSLRK